MNLRRLPFQLFSISALSTWLLLASGHAQTIKPLSYNTTNFTVVGWTNTNAVTFTNSLSIFGPASARIVLAVEGGATNTIIAEGDGLSFYTGGAIYFYTDNSESPSGAVVFAKPLKFTAGAHSTTRSNLFGAPGLSATITNGGLVFVFTNGILASTNAP